MATRSSIAIKNGDKIVSIYCHWDGYLDGVGETLKQHWTTEEKINQLMELGDLSTLGSEIGEKHEFDNPHKFGTPEYQEFNDKYDSWCLAYGRDRNEPDTKAKEHFSINGWINNRTNSGCEYMYLFDDGFWTVYKS